jgi:hypothetical protein
VMFCLAFTIPVEVIAFSLTDVQSQSFSCHQERTGSLCVFIDSLLCHTIMFPTPRESVGLSRVGMPFHPMTSSSMNSRFSEKYLTMKSRMSSHSPTHLALERCRGVLRVR